MKYTAKVCVLCKCKQTVPTSELCQQQAGGVAGVYLTPIKIQCTAHKSLREIKLTPTVLCDLFQRVHEKPLYRWALVLANYHE